MAAQLPDKIVIDGKEMDLYSNPLEEYWITKEKRRPMFCTTMECRRGYIATWMLIDNQLYLKDVSGAIRRRNFILGDKIVNCTLEKLFSKPGKLGVKADWFSGKLRIPDGSMTMFEDNEYDSRFEKEIILSIDHGNIVKRVTLDKVRHTLIYN